MIYTCCDEFRRAALADPQQNPTGLNGIDYLEVLDHDASMFSANDLADLPGLRKKLVPHAHRDKVSAFVWQQFTRRTQRLLQNPRSSSLARRSALVSEFNQTIQSGRSIYTAHRFVGVPLSAKTHQLLVQRLSGENVLRLNRLLLEDAYPLEIARSPDRQCMLLVHFVNDLSGAALTKTNLVIEGGERVTPITVTDATPGTGLDAKVLKVQVNQPGDYSTYTLRIVQEAQLQPPQPPAGYDPLLSAIDFSFKVECPSDFDCQPRRICPPPAHVEPEINYLAKDYASFRRLMLDRIALLSPQWKERHAADLGVALVELLAFVGDYLSYQQDAVGTEAYVGTARRRISVRRHARLVDYRMDDGCNARTWVQIQVNADTGPLPKGTRLFTRIPGQPVVLPDDPRVLRQAQAGFETMHDILLFKDHTAIPFYTWTEQRCCLPKGATRATLDGHFPNLKKDDVLLLEEIVGPDTGQPGDADPTHRQAVRLTSDPILDTDPLDNHLITEIEWAADDALTFPLCISAYTDEEHGNKYLDNTVSVARGNIVLADHGLIETNPPIPAIVPEPTIFRPPATDSDHCIEAKLVPIPPRYRPQLQDQPLTQAAPFDATASAAAAMQWNVHDALPAVWLQSTRNSITEPWYPQGDLLNSAPDANEFVAEIDSDGAAYLRFGDDQLGRRPDPLTAFTATYRVGNGTAGNVGAESLAHIVTSLTAVTLVRNPLPAQGGVEPETIEEVRQHAPAAFRTQERAVTEADYAEVTQRDSRVQRAAATFRWTGSWHTVFLTADRFGGLPVDDAFKTDIRQLVERYRMAGYDLEVDGPRFVSLDIAMHVCVLADHFRSDVKAALLDVFSNRLLPDGRRGVFHPDNFTFGQTVWLSPLYAAAQAVPGVASVEITRFQRQSSPFDPLPLAAGKLTMGRLEIARCDNDPNFAERGVFTLSLGGGK
ncbi:MAG TPA: putative baseplate assembly protein [Verrucomicrobiae bacterium]|nr:putative baseplate assembly protein [Verrucomicrobiae bacterium]